MPETGFNEQSYRRYALYEKGHRPFTVSQTLSILNHLQTFAHTNSLSLLDTSIIREFLQTQREEKGWKPKTFRIYRQYLKTYFDWAVLQGYVRKNPVIPIGNPKLPITLPRCLTREQAQKFMAHCRYYNWLYELEPFRNEAIIATFLYTGIRLKELINLRHDDVMIELGEIRINCGKGSKDRTIAIHPLLKPLLLSYSEKRKQLGKPSIWFFPSVRSEKRLTSKNVQAIFKKLSSASGIKVTPHVLRHTCGRLYVEANVNLRVIQSLLGHSRPETTQIYTYVSTKNMKESLGKISTALWLKFHAMLLHLLPEMPHDNTQVDNGRVDRRMSK